MSFTYGRKLLFSIFIDGNQGDPPLELSPLQEDFPPDSSARENAELKFAAGPRLVEQIGFYYDKDNNKAVFTGVANAQRLIEVPEHGRPQMVMDSTGQSSNVQALVDAVIRDVGLEGAKSTWVVVPLDELGNGFGTLYTGGMAGISEG
jgi:hypothetical protein